MKFLIIAKEDFFGAGKAALRICESLKRENHSCCLLVQNKSSISNPDILKYGDLIRSSYLCRLKQFLTNRIFFRRHKNIKTHPDFYFFGLNDLNLSIDVRRIVSKLPFIPDIILLTWTSQFFSPAAVSSLQKQTKAKLIVYPMDMSLLTGGCHYAWNCEGYTKDCDYCPAILTEDKKWIAHKNLNAKKRNYTNAGAHLVVGSEQLRLEGKKSSLFFEQPVILKAPIPINQQIFNRNQRSRAKGNFGIPEEKKVLFFGASFTMEKRKGVGLFMKVLSHLNDLANIKKTDLVILIAGAIPDEKILNDIAFQVVCTGYINDDHQLSLAYQAATVFVNTSIQDSGPMMINEAIVCGTPVVSFDIGIARDLVVENISGFAVELKDLNAMVAAIAKIVNLSPVEFESLSKAANEFGTKQCNDTQFSSTITNVSNYKYGSEHSG